MEIEWVIEELKHEKTCYCCDEKKLENIDQLWHSTTIYSAKFAGSAFPTRLTIFLEEGQLLNLREMEIDLTVGLPNQEYVAEAHHLLQLIRDGKGVLKARKCEYRDGA